MFTNVLLWTYLVKIAISKPPNIFFIIVDDLGYAEVGFNRQTPDSEVKTPNIDQLAIKEGLILGSHYVHYTCTPTRSSFQSGRYPVHVQLTLADPDNPNSGIPRNMTTIGNKLQSKGYYTSFTGKWDCGMASPQHTPKLRGYNTSYFYFEHENEYWTQRIMNTKCLNTPGYENLTDLWMSNSTYNGPALQYNGTDYEEYLFANQIYKEIDYIVNDLDSNTPFMVVYTPHIAHMPLQLPEDVFNEFNFSNDENLCYNWSASCKVYDIYPNQTFGPEGYRCRSQYHGMVYILDNIIGNITAKLKKNNLWENTLLVFSTDNGGSLWLESNAGNNYPMRGGKFSPLEGGIRGAAFVSGGLLPEKRIGKREMGMIHICDWYYTFCKVNGINPSDPNAKIYGYPDVDGMNIWPLIFGENETSPRTEIPVDESTLIQNGYKLLLSSKIQFPIWTGPTFPNSTSPQNDDRGNTMDCSHGCLYNLTDDITEHHDISSSNQDIVNNLKARLKQLSPGFYSNNETGIDSCPKDIPKNTTCPCWIAKNKYGGYLGPWQYLES